MLTTLNICARVVSSQRITSRMAIVTALIASALAGAACSGSPAGPGVLSAGRRVQDGGGGGTICSAGTCPGFDGRVTLTAGGGTLTGSTTGVIEGAEDAFRFTSQLTGTGRFKTGFLDIQVTGDTALINNLWYSNGPQVFQDKGDTVSAVVVRGEKCQIGRDQLPGVIVQTTINGVFENFGQTTIVEEHCVAI
jgi:hypothetical protein